MEERGGRAAHRRLEEVVLGCWRWVLLLDMMVFRHMFENYRVKTICFFWHSKTFASVLQITSRLP